MQQLVSCLPIEDAIPNLIEELNVSTVLDTSFGSGVPKPFGYDDDDGE